MAIDKTTIVVQYLNSKKNVNIIDFPTECPICHKHSIPTISCAVFGRDDNELYVSFHC